MKILFNKKIYFSLVLSAIFLPCSVFASTVYIDTSHSEFFVGDTIMFSVRVDSLNKNINAVAGNVLMNYGENLISLVDINTSSSVFSLWPSRPLPSVTNTSVSFAGGIPGGLNSKDAIIFNIVLKLQQEGQITLTPDNIEVYLNDGEGTKDVVSVKNLVINVLPKTSDSQPADDWNNITLNDKTPPEPFEILLGQEESVFDGRKFLSWSAIDKQSGISYYEVIEGDRPAVRSSDTYILQEQNESVEVVVIAYDASGNSRESIYSVTAPNYVVYVVWFVIIIIIILFVFIFRKMRKNKNEFTQK